VLVIEICQTKHNARSGSAAGVGVELCPELKIRSFAAQELEAQRLAGGQGVLRDVEDGLNLAAQQRQDGDYNQGDEADQQAILHQRLSFLFLNKTFDHLRFTSRWIGVAFVSGDMGMSSFALQLSAAQRVALFSPALLSRSCTVVAKGLFWRKFGKTFYPEPPCAKLKPFFSIADDNFLKCLLFCPRRTKFI
jgi:hypothetical protein